MNASDVQAGPELNDRVAKDVMCWTQTEGMYGRMWWGNPHGNHQLWMVEAFCPSTDIAAAWQVVEHFCERGWQVLVDWDGPRFGAWVCELWEGEGKPEDIGANAPTAPLAICRAALAALSS